MNTTHIDHLSDLKIETLTFKDIAAHVGTGNDISEGTGRNKTHKYRLGFITDIGDIEESV